MFHKQEKLLQQKEKTLGEIQKQLEIKPYKIKHNLKFIKTFHIKGKLTSIVSDANKSEKLKIRKFYKIKLY